MDALKETQKAFPAYEDGGNVEVARRLHKHVTDEEMLRWSQISRKTGMMGTTETRRYFEVQMCQTCLGRMNALETGQAVHGDDEGHRLTSSRIPVFVVAEKTHLDSDELRNWPDLPKDRLEHQTGCPACRAKVRDLEEARRKEARSLRQSITEYFFGDHT